LTIEVDNRTIEKIKPVAASLIFRWIQIKDVSLKAGRHTLTLSNDGNGRNDIDAITIYSRREMQNDFNNVFMDQIQKGESRLIWLLEAENILTDFQLLEGSSDWWLSPLKGGIASNGWTVKSDSKNAFFSNNIFIPRSSQYMIKLRVATGPEYGNISIQIDDNIDIFTISCENSKEEMTWKEIGIMNLDVGDHVIKFVNKNENMPSEIDEILIYEIFDEYKKSENLPFFVPQERNITLSYEMLNPTEYKVLIKTEIPFILCFSESFHPLWKAYVSGEEFESILSYSMMNAFFIDQIGSLEITISFIGQRYVYTGAIISVSTILIVALSSFFYDDLLRESLLIYNRLKALSRRKRYK
jgi:hypothetical protein